MVITEQQPIIPPGRRTAAVITWFQPKTLLARSQPEDPLDRPP